MILAKSGFQNGYDKSLEQAALILPKVGYFLLILIVGIIVAKLVQKIITKVLQKAGFDKVVERGGIKQALSKSKYDAASILGKIVYYFIFLAVLSMAFAVFGKDNPISEFLASIIAFLPKLFVAVIALIIAFAVAAAVKDLLANMLGGLSYGSALANGVSLFIIALGVFFALGQLEIATLIVGPLFIALLALIVVPPIIAFGIGGIDPARETIRNMQAKSRVKANEIKTEARSSSAEGSAAAPARRPRTATKVATPRRRATS
ncbi:MAG: hypothetical protein LC789_12825 [Actinobacteria bacterium]|nr:hypothetical protein [Actinomycetota bacterium]MCA1722107.1 hypothetical protein [Actinomycetota bacterium]